MNLETPKVFEANPSALKRRVFLIAGLAGIAAIAVAIVGRGKLDYTPHFLTIRKSDRARKMQRSIFTSTG